MSKPVGRWNDEAHTALLIALLDEVKGGKAVVTKATERLNEMGYNYTYNAVKYYRKALLHIQKLRRTRDVAALNTDGGDDSGASKPATPRKTATPRKRRTPSKKSAKTADDDEDDEESGDVDTKPQVSDTEMESPSKRVKKERTPAGNADDDEEVDVDGEF
ncbi:hypothetical protein K4F52_002523 [Lecanicillium sp. MT-2017a]|nr:hypothetical protein K4F52_002523 [Lecanicillium sp. MT-2017a]